jgi:hypothetical protein
MVRPYFGSLPGSCAACGVKTWANETRNSGVMSFSFCDVRRVTNRAVLVRKPRLNDGLAHLVDDEAAGEQRAERVIVELRIAVHLDRPTGAVLVIHDDQ